MFTGSADAAIVASAVANYANPDAAVRGLRRDPAAQRARERLHPGRLVHPGRPCDLGRRRCTILGTEGYIELRKYVDIAGRDGADHLFLVDREATRHVDCREAPLPYYERLIADVFERTEAAMPQAHCFKACELAVTAQAQAERLA